MLNLERNAQTKRAITCGMQNHNFAAGLGNASDLTVSGKSQKEYTVKLLKGTDGHAEATCDQASSRRVSGQVT